MALQYSTASSLLERRKGGEASGIPPSARGLASDPGSWNNPTSGKWMRAADFLHYEHNSAAFYEDGKSGYSKLLKIEEVM